MFDESENLWNDAERLATKAYQLYEDGELTAAYKQLRKAIKINPCNSAWLFNTGLTLDGLERHEEALECFQDAIVLAGDDPEILNCIAVDYTRLGQYDRAIETFEYIQQLDPEFEPCYCNRIITYTEMDKHDKAEEMFYLAQQIKEDCPICFYNIGNSLFVRGYYVRAAWCWQQTAGIDSEHPQINHRIAQAHWADGNMKLAMAHFIEELRHNPGSMNVVMDFGIFLLASGEIENAKEKFGRVLEMEPENASAMLYRGDIELDNGNIAAAENWYEQAREVDPNLSGPTYRLGQIAMQKGDRKKAARLFKNELLHGIDDAAILISMGQMLLGVGEVDDATDCFLAAVDNDPDNGKAFSMIGSTLLMRDEPEPEGAAQFFEHSQALGYTDSRMTEELAGLYLVNGETKLAAEVIAKGFAAGQSNAKLRRLKMRIRCASLWGQITDDLFDRIKVKAHMTASLVKCKLRRLINRLKKRY